MHTYCLDIQRTIKVKDIGSIEKGLVQPHYSKHYIEGYHLLCYNYYKQYLHSSIIETINKDYCPGIMNIYFIRDSGTYKSRKDYQDYHDMDWYYTRCWTMCIACFYLTCQVCQMKNKERKCKKCELLPLKIA
jgi:hypothetical protein